MHKLPLFLFPAALSALSAMEGPVTDPELTVYQTSRAGDRLAEIAIKEEKSAEKVDFRLEVDPEATLPDLSRGGGLVHGIGGIGSL